jgi:DNA/RNA endonuclease YhcR with UshA esterase domain
MNKDLPSDEEENRPTETKKKSDDLSETIVPMTVSEPTSTTMKGRRQSMRGKYTVNPDQQNTARWT